MDDSDERSDARPIALDSPAGRWLLAVAILGSAVAQIEATVVSVALPAIGAELDAGIAGLQWVLNGYLLTLASLILLGGSLGDRLGRRRIFVTGVGLFTVTSLVCAVAPNIEALIAGRALQGVGGALLTPGSLAMLEALLRPQDRAKAIGAWSALLGVAAAIGPLLGGWLVEYSWRWIFVIPVPLGVFVAVVGLSKIPESRNESATGPVDRWGAVLATLALGGLTFALVQAETAPVAAVVAAVVGAGAAVAFVVVERRQPSPMMPLDIFSSRQFSAANAITFVVYAALGGVFFLLVVFLQTSLGYTPLQAGAASLPITVVMLALSSSAGALAQRIGPRWPLTVGPATIAAGMLLMLRIEPGSAYLTDVLPAVIVFGLGLAATVAPVTATVLAAVEERRAGVASGVNNAVARTAQLAAVAALPLAVGLTGEEYADPVALTDAFHLAMVLTAGLSLAGGVIAAFTIRADVLHDEPCQHHVHCAVAGPPPRESTATRA
ncbi:MAG TPA: MFS transporter [Actinomycetales bacterium]|nr:MFS transporter [Actinomycetales bacterium]